MAPKRNFNADKGCNCKNTNCLKLYCVCFAAGHYCTRACSCKECFNLFGYKNKVDKAREQAELRNPYAFSTKEVDDRMMPTVEKQKMGCRCRVNLCMGDMCKCYKANVGCQDQCRCVGCNNVHGKRGGMVPLDPLDESLNQFIPQKDINARYLPSTFETLNPDMMIGTSWLIL